MKIGEFVVMPMHEGHLLIDGGVAFGAIPKTEWQRLATADEDNRVLFGNSFFLLQTDSANVLVDTGIGTKREQMKRPHAHFARLAAPEELLASAGLERGDVDIVILTHLHYASAGNLTFINDEGVLEPSFPNARVVIQQGEWEKGIHPNIRTRALYEKEDFEPLLWHQKLELIEGDVQLLPSLWVRVTGGHTENHQIVTIEREDEGAIFWGDLVPSVNHLHLEAISAQDLEPIVSMEMKGEWLERAITGAWVNFFSRDPHVAAALVKGTVRHRGVLECEPLITH